MNELTLYEVDPVSKQPHYKASAVRVRRVTEGHVARQRQPQTVAGQGD